MIGWPETPDSTLAVRNWFNFIWLQGRKDFGFTAQRLAPPSPVGRSGFGGVDYVPYTDRLLTFYHHAEAPRGTYVAIEKIAGLFDWDQEYNVPDSFPGRGGEAIGNWPDAAGQAILDVNDLDNDGDTTDTVEVIHLFFLHGDLSTISIDYYLYARAVDSSGAGHLYFPGPGFVGDANSYMVDSGQRTSPVVVTSKQSEKVALIWTSEHVCNFNVNFCSDIYYLESTNGGQDWVDAGGFSGFTPVNVTNLDSSAVTRPTGDLQAIYDERDSLVISFLQYCEYDPGTGAQSQQADIYVWTKENGVRKAVDGNFPDLVDASIPGSSFRSTLNWPHIAVHDGTGNPDREGYYYMIYTQFGGHDSVSLADTNVEGFYNGEIYLTASTNHGKTWSVPINLTDSKTPDCTKGTCSGISYSSCAERADDTLHIVFMSDLYAGRFDDNPLALRTDNPIIYMKYSLPFIDCFPWSWISPILFILDPDTLLTDSFYIGTFSCEELVIDSIIVNGDTLDPGDSLAYWLTVDSTKAGGFTIPEGGADVPVPFTLNAVSYVREISGALDTVNFEDGIYADTINCKNSSLQCGQYR
jgi:hypothetical protein